MECNELHAPRSDAAREVNMRAVFAPMRGAQIARVVALTCVVLAGIGGCALGSTADVGDHGGTDAAIGSGATGGKGGKGGSGGSGGIPGGAQGRMDAGRPGAGTPDAAPRGDAATDAGPADGATDAGVDAGTDAGVDAGTDAGMDAGMPPPTGTALFGGAYSTEKTDSCPAPFDCYTANPLVTGGTTCGCPAAFPNLIGPLNHLDDRGGAGMPCQGGNPPYGWASSFVCYAGAFDAAKTDFGGAYHKAENGSCYIGNPMNANQCSCPTGSQAIELIADHACYGNSKIGFCWNGAAPRTSFGGAFLTGDTYGCVVPNPATGGCTCPSDCANISIRSIYGPGDEGTCSNSGAFGAHLNICRKI